MEEEKDEDPEVVRERILKRFETMIESDTKVMADS
jgi:hypothetical protein